MAEEWDVRFRGIVGDRQPPPSHFPGEQARIDHLECGLCHVSSTSAAAENKREVPLQQVEQEEPQFPITQYYMVLLESVEALVSEGVRKKKLGMSQRLRSHAVHVDKGSRLVRVAEGLRW